MLRICLAQCQFFCCSDVVNCPLANIKLDRHIVMTGRFFVAQFADYVRDAYAKKMPTKFQQKAIVDNFHREGTDILVNNK